MKIENLPLHDVTLNSMHFSWDEGNVVLELAQHDSPMSTLTFEGVSRLDVPRKFPWGRSVSINAARKSTPFAFEVEMQSGDIILIFATGWSFQSHAAGRA